MIFFSRILFVMGVLLVSCATNAVTEGLERTSVAAGVTGVATPTNLYDPAAPTIDFRTCAGHQGIASARRYRGIVPAR